MTGPQAARGVETLPHGVTSEPGADAGVGGTQAGHVWDGRCEGRLPRKHSDVTEEWQQAASTSWSLLEIVEVHVVTDYMLCTHRRGAACFPVVRN